MITTNYYSHLCLFCYFVLLSQQIFNADATLFFISVRRMVFLEGQFSLQKRMHGKEYTDSLLSKPQLTIYQQDCVKTKKKKPLKCRGNSGYQTRNNNCIFTGPSALLC